VDPNANQLLQPNDSPSSSDVLEQERRKPLNRSGVEPGMITFTGEYPMTPDDAAGATGLLTCTKSLKAAKAGRAALPPFNQVLPKLGTGNPLLKSLVLHTCAAIDNAHEVFIFQINNQGGNIHNCCQCCKRNPNRWDSHCPQKNRLVIVKNNTHCNHHSAPNSCHAKIQKNDMLTW
jgi:hypothetical protein